jgi:hypothetical protein
MTTYFDKLFKVVEKNLTPGKVGNILNGHKSKLIPQPHNCSVPFKKQIHSNAHNSREKKHIRRHGRFVMSLHCSVIQTAHKLGHTKEYCIHSQKYHN